MTVLHVYPSPGYNEVCYKGTGMCTLPDIQYTIKIKFSWLVLVKIP